MIEEVRDHTLTFKGHIGTVAIKAIWCTNIPTCDNILLDYDACKAREDLFTRLRAEVANDWAGDLY